MGTLDGNVAWELGNLFLETCSCKPDLENLSLETYSREPCLETCLGNLFLKTLLGDLACESVLGNLAWEPGLGTPSWEPGNLAQWVLAAPACSAVFRAFIVSMSMFGG